MALKDTLLTELEAHRENAVSGQALAEALGVTRAAVWKAIKALEADGHRITAAPNRGYRLEAGSDVVSPQAIRQHLSPHWPGCTIRTERSVDSTNTLAKKLAADGAPDQTVIVSDAQTRGRGRMGRPFFSPAGGLYMSVILRPHLRAEAVSVLTIAAAAAVCQAIEALTPHRTAIKWVNDVLVDGKKVCGILTEAVTDFESGMVESVAVGIGVNVRTPPEGFPPELQKNAGSLFPEHVSRAALAAGIIDRLLGYAQTLPDRAFLDFYRSRSIVLGRRVRFSQGETRLEGRAAAIDGDGGLLVESEGNAVLLRAGEIEILEDRP